MSIPIFVVVIEKFDDSYIAYTPNIAGLKVAATDREEVERVILDEMIKYVDGLSEPNADNRVKVTTAPLAEKIRCRYRYNDQYRRGELCRAPSQHEGLCIQHWKILFGHEVNRKDRFQKCQLCNEEDPLKLVDKWARCIFKVEHEDWWETLAAKRKETSLQKRQSEAAELQRSRANKIRRQCSATKTQGPKGFRCSNEAVRYGLCMAHWRRAND